MSLVVQILDGNAHQAHTTARHKADVSARAATETYKHEADSRQAVLQTSNATRGTILHGQALLVV